MNADLDLLLAAQHSDTTGFSVHTDQAPAFWLNIDPGQSAATTRQFERDLLALTIQDPYVGTTVPVLDAIADQPALDMLHMVTAGPLRTPTVVGFDRGDIYVGVGAVTTSLPGCAGQAVCTGTSCAWNHGGINSVVRRTWSGMVGPGVRPVGIDNDTWADHVDMRATMLALLHLQDDYAHDGRIIVENLDPSILPTSISAHLPAYRRLAAAYKTCERRARSLFQNGVRRARVPRQRHAWRVFCKRERPSSREHRKRRSARRSAGIAHSGIGSKALKQPALSPDGQSLGGLVSGFQIGIPV